MLRKDFILRLIEEVAKAIAQMLKLLKDNDVVTADQLYNSCFGMMKGISEEDLMNTNVSDFYEQLAKEHSDVDDYYQSMGYLLYVGGNIEESKGNLDIAQKKWAKALDILEHIDLNSSTYSFERISLIEKVKTAISKR